ncbi:MAG: hypothetical protein CM15mP39_11830 [Synechococcus sp.]|nr:MAG: hypothetical protein CM15mP39_11830 [Synechococcus sp.]
MLQGRSRDQCCHQHSFAISGLRLLFCWGRHLLALQHRAGLRVVDHERPEPLSRGIGRDVEFVSLRSIQVGAAASRELKAYWDPRQEVPAPSPACSLWPGRRTACGHPCRAHHCRHPRGTCGCRRETGLPITGLAGIDVCLGILRANRIDRAVALPMATASVSRAFCSLVGLNGFPFECQSPRPCPRVQGEHLGGSRWITSSSSS